MVLFVFLKGWIHEGEHGRSFEAGSGLEIANLER